VLLVVVGTAAAVGGVLLVAPRRALPQTSGTLEVDGLLGDVDVVRDVDGVPHVFASNLHDLFFAQGFVHAQDRFWQMDFWRHIGSGTLAELFGADQVDTDAFLRTLGWRHIAETQYAALSPADRDVLDAYAAGVNAYLRDRSPSELSFEYTILDAINHDYDPAPWTPEDTLTWGLVMAWDLGGNLGDELGRALDLGVMSADRVDELYPPYPAENPVIVTGTGPARHARAIASLPHDVDTVLRRVRDRIDHLAALRGRGTADTGVGSNSWVVSGALTATGAPILANDPHLSLQMPSIWYQIDLRCSPVGPACPLEVAGFSFAGVPGVVIGHNAHIAWGFTNLGPDVEDLVIEKIDPADPHRYEFRGKWLDMDVHTETIRVAGAPSVDVEVRTTRHGPIISDTYGALAGFDQAGVELPEPYAIALRWTALEPSAGVVTPILGLDRAANWTEFRAALAGFDVPAQNVIYADTAGHIGYQAPGKIPVRSSGDGTLPVPGWTGEYEWTGFVPYDELPRVLDPPSGFVVTANNAVTESGAGPFLTADWDAGYRARRIVDLLASNPGLTVRDHGWIQYDDYDLWGERLVPFILGAGRSGFDATASAAFSALAGWDLHDDAASSGAAIFNATWSHLLSLTFDDELPESQRPIGGSRWVAVVSGLLDRPDDPFWDDVTTPAREDRDDTLRRAFLAAVAELRARLGDDPATWRWGDVHTVRFANPTIGSSGIGLVDDRFDRGPFPASGTKTTPNAVGWTATKGYQVDWLPSMRMLVDLGDLDRSLAIHTTGESGHVGSPHYDDMIRRWLDGGFAPMRWDRATIDAATEAILHLTPAG